MNPAWIRKTSLAAAVLLSLSLLSGCSLLKRVVPSFVSDGESVVVLRDAAVAAKETVEEEPGSIRLSLLKDGVEFNVICPLLSGRKLVSTVCQSLQVGDIVKYLDGCARKDPSGLGLAIYADELRAR